MEETAWRPGQSVAEDVQCRQIDPDPLVAMAAFQAAAQMNPADPEVQRMGSSLFNAGRSEDALPFLKQLAINMAEGFQ